MWDVAKRDVWIFPYVNDVATGVCMCVHTITRLHYRKCLVAYIPGEHLLTWEIGCNGCIHEKQEVTRDAFLDCLLHLVLPYRSVASDPNYYTLPHQCHSSFLQNTLYPSSSDCRREKTNL